MCFSSANNGKRYPQRLIVQASISIEEVRAIPRGITTWETEFE